MKKLGLLGLTVTLIGGLGACSNETYPLTQVEPKPKLLEDEGIAPFKFSGEDLYLLQSIQLQQQTQMLSYHAPDKAQSMSVKVYSLNDELEWEVANINPIEITNIANTEMEETELIGTLVLKYNNEFVDVIINNTEGPYSFWAEFEELKEDYVASAYSHLHNLQEIELNEEIPIAIRVFDNGTTIPAFDVFGFNTPQKFSELDYVQAITVTFSE